MNACATDGDPKVLEDATLQTPDNLPFELDLYTFCAIVRQPNTLYADGDTVRPPEPCGFALECIEEGTTGEDMPPFLAKLGVTFRDGGARWEVVEAAGNGINAATDPTSEVSPEDSGGLSVTDLAMLNSTTLVGTYVPGVRGESYEVTFSFEVAGVPRAARQTVRVT